jgi:hypothetical protein
MSVSETLTRARSRRRMREFDARGIEVTNNSDLPVVYFKYIIRSMRY